MAYNRPGDKKDSAAGNGPEKGDLKREFGRVVSHPDIHDGSPILQKGNIKVFDILDMIRDGKSDKQICRKYAKHGINEGDIDACRAYQARFLKDTIINAFAEQNGERYFMLDENVTYMVLPKVIELFGTSSHVLADKLYNENNDDEENIWAHVIEEGYKAVLTGDTDFQMISHNYRNKMIAKYGSLEKCKEHIPAVIFIKGHMSKTNLGLLLEKYEDDIKAYVESNHADYARLTTKGLTFHQFDITKSPKHAHLAPRP